MSARTEKGGRNESVLSILRVLHRGRCVLLHGQRQDYVRNRDKTRESLQGIRCKRSRFDHYGQEIQPKTAEKEIKGCAII